MSQRVVRVNELLKREISLIVHTRFRGSTVAITITEVDTEPTLHKARVFYTVIGDEDAHLEARRFFASKGREIRAEIAKVIVLKYLPHFEFLVDSGSLRGNRLDSIFDELGLEGTGATTPTEDMTTHRESPSTSASERDFD